MLHSVIFKFDHETLYRLGRRFGHEGRPASPMELTDYIRHIVQENFKPNKEDERPSLKIKKRKKH